MKIKLEEAAVIKPGYPFRGKMVEIPNGDALVVQMKDVKPDLPVNWTSLIQSELKGWKKPDWLQTGDILVLARGNHNFAICMDKVPVKAVCSPHFFMIQIKSKTKLIPEFLAWQINQAPAQRHLELTATGTLQRNLRRLDLETLPVTVPPLDIQRNIVKMAQVALREKQVLQDLIINRDRQMMAIASKILG